MNKSDFFEILSNEYWPRQVLYDDNGQPIKFQCKICFQPLGSQSGLEFHLITTHKAGGLVSCPYCKNKSASGEGLKSHMKDHKGLYCEADYDKIMMEVNAINVSPSEAHKIIIPAKNEKSENTLKNVPHSSAATVSTRIWKKSEEAALRPVLQKIEKALNKIAVAKSALENRASKKIEAGSMEEKVEKLKRGATGVARLHQKNHLEKIISGIIARKIKLIKHNQERKKYEKMGFDENTRKNPSRKCVTKSVAGARPEIRVRVKASGESIKMKNMLQPNKIPEMVRREEQKGKRKQLKQLIVSTKERSVYRLENRGKTINKTNGTLHEDINHEENVGNINQDKTWLKDEIINVLGETPEEVYADLIQLPEEVLSASVDSQSVEETRPLCHQLFENFVEISTETEKTVCSQMSDETTSAPDNTQEAVATILAELSTAAKRGSDETLDKDLNETNQTETLPVETFLIGLHESPQVNGNGGEGMVQLSPNQELADVFDEKMSELISREELLKLFEEMDTRQNELTPVEPPLPAPVPLKRVLLIEEPTQPEPRYPVKTFSAPNVNNLPQSTQNVVSIEANVRLPQEVNIVHQTARTIAGNCDAIIRSKQKTKPKRNCRVGVRKSKSMPSTGESSCMQTDENTNNSLAAKSSFEINGKFDKQLGGVSKKTLKNPDRDDRITADDMLVHLNEMGELMMTGILDNHEPLLQNHEPDPDFGRCDALDESPPAPSTGLYLEPVDAAGLNIEPLPASEPNAQFYIPICSQVAHVDGSAAPGTPFTQIRHLTTLNIAGTHQQDPDGTILDKLIIPEEFQHLVKDENGKFTLRFGDFFCLPDEPGSNDCPMQSGQLSLDMNIFQRLMSEEGRICSPNPQCQGVLHATFDLASGHFTAFNCTNNLEGMTFPIPEHVKKLAECVEKNINHELVTMSTDLHDWVLCSLSKQLTDKYKDRRKFSAFNKLTGETILFLLKDGNEQMDLSQGVCAKPTQTVHMTKYTVWYGSNAAVCWQRVDEQGEKVCYELGHIFNGNNNQT